MVFKRTASLLFVLLQAFFLSGQTNISGIINTYWQVLSVDVCNNRVALPVIATGIANGDRVILMQMTGAEINTDDAPTYGSIIDYRDAGNYEILTISDINNNIITFEEVMIKTYDPVNGKVQMILVPQYTDADITGTLTAAPWDGKSGGVLAFEASGTVTFSADADVTGLGFAGGAILHHSGCFGGGTGASGYRCDLVDECGGNKGEAIADNGGFELGRGAPANGGGGGNDNNTGGGGGSNFASGGQGGQRLNTTATDCQGLNPGLGGYPLSYSNASSKVFMGGGGGSGDDNTNEATAGASGGGIVIIRANSVSGNNFSIFANGATPPDTAHQDGAGGGGGAGTVLMDVSSFTSPVNIQVNGGKGGDVDNGNVADSCFGPGGGGGAGLVWVSGASVPANLVPSEAGGQPGLTLNGNAPAACNGLSNGATSGSAGGTLTGLVIPESTVIFVPLTLEVSNDTIVCVGTDATLVATATGTGTLTYDWNYGTSTPTNIVTVNSPATFTVTVTDALGCSITDEIFVDVTFASVTASVFPDSILVGQSVQLLADTVGNEFYIWYPPIGISDITAYNPKATPPDTIEYCVIVTGYNGCLDTACVTVEVLIPEPALNIPTAFTPNGDGLNDTWELLVHPCYTITDILVYNRWGQTVFNYKDAGTPSWNGTLNGEPQPMETYIYYIRATCSERNSEEVYRGNVTIIK